MLVLLTIINIIIYVVVENKLLTLLSLCSLIYLSKSPNQLYNLYSKLMVTYNTNQ